MRYRAYGIALESDLLLPELDRDAGSQPPALHVVATADPAGDGWTWTQPPLTDAQAPWLAVGTRGGRHRVLFDTGADFIVDGARRQIAVLAGPAPDSAVRHRLIDQVIPLVLAHLSGVVLHASAVMTPSGAVAFVGPSGAGKSTLAAALARTGAEVLADDALILEPGSGGLNAVPSYPGVRVRPDVLPVIGEAAGSPSDAKRRAGAGDGVAFTAGRARLTRIYALGPEPGAVIGIERLAPRETIMALVAHAFVLDISDRRRVAAHFARVAELSACADVRSLVYPHELAALPAVREAIQADLGRA